MSNALLSDLILQGCRLAPNQHASFWTKDGQSACAFGAALLAVQPDSYKSVEHADGCWTALDNAVGYKTGSRKVAHPVSGHDWYLANVIFELNGSFHGWTREQIAEWLKGLGL